MRFIRTHRTKLIALVIWGIIIAAAWATMSAQNLSPGELVQRLRETLAGTWYGGIVYILIYLARPLILFPASWLTILAGSIFGLGLGFVFALIAGTLSAIFPYAVGRWFAQDIPTESRLQRFVTLIQRTPFRATLIMRLLYLPYDVVSLFLGGLRVPLLLFLGATALGNIGGTFTFVGFGAAFQDSVATGDISAFNPTTILISLVVLVVSLGVSRHLSKNSYSGK